MEKENRELLMRDLFISHASEDKHGFVRQFVQALIKEGVSVWYDEYELRIGCDLAEEIDKGLAHSRFGVAVLSPNFFKLSKTWPKREIGAMTALEDAEGRKMIFPLLHEIDRATATKQSPILGRLFTWETKDFSPEELAKKFRDELKTRHP
jgi:hypothetical protein